MIFFFYHFWPKIIFLNIFLSFSYLINFFSHKDLGFILFLYCRYFIDVWFVVGLLLRGVVCHLIMTLFICMETIYTDKIDLINRI